MAQPSQTVTDSVRQPQLPTTASFRPFANFIKYPAFTSWKARLELFISKVVRLYCSQVDGVFTQTLSRILYIVLQALSTLQCPGSQGVYSWCQRSWGLTIGCATASASVVQNELTFFAGVLESALQAEVSWPHDLVVKKHPETARQILSLRQFNEISPGSVGSTGPSRKDYVTRYVLNP